MVYESTLERDAAYILIADSRVASIIDQPEPVEYVDEDGVVHQHTFDFLVKLHDGKSVAIAVKPSKKVVSSGLDVVVAMIRKQAPKGFADSIVIRTEEFITRDRAHNARLILRCLRDRRESDVAQVMAFAKDLRGAVTIAALKAATLNSPRGFFAINCLIGDGVLELVGTGRITDTSMVRPGRNHNTNKH